MYLLDAFYHVTSLDIPSHNICNNKLFLPPSQLSHDGGGEGKGWEEGGKCSSMEEVEL
jgi:hypothetical protein